MFNFKEYICLHSSADINQYFVYFLDIKILTTSKDFIYQRIKRLSSAHLLGKKFFMNFFLISKFNFWKNRLGSPCKFKKISQQKSVRNLHRAYMRALCKQDKCICLCIISATYWYWNSLESIIPMSASQLYILYKY